MKTRLTMIIFLSIAVLILILGIGIGVKKNEIGNKNSKMNTEDSNFVASRVFSLIILDESGSMSGMEKVCVDGVNETIQTIRSSYEMLPDQQQFLTFLTFSSQGSEWFRTHLDRADIVNVKEYNIDDYKPNGGTPLYDAMGFSLTRLESYVATNDIVLVTVITDGYENTSTDYDSEKLKALIEKLSDKNWVFTYIGANQDAVLEAGRIGIKNAMNYDPSLGGTRNMWRKERAARDRFFEGARSGTAVQRLKEGYFYEDDKE